MGTSLALRPSVRSAFAGLIDYAGLFPPAQLSLAQATDEYRQARAGSNAWMLGRFVIPATLLIESRAACSGPFSVIVDGAGDTLAGVRAAREAGATIEALEVPLAQTRSSDEISNATERLHEAIAAAGLGGLPAFVEIPRSDRGPDLAPWMAQLARRGFAAKLRCGGVTAKAFPSVEEVAGFIAAAHAMRVPFKATAGLHHPFRHLDPATGFTMHGFVNLLIATALAPRAEMETLRHVVAEEDPGAFAFDQAFAAWRDRRISIEDLTQARRAFIAYGSCSFTEPVEDLAALGLLTQQ